MAYSTVERSLTMKAAPAAIVPLISDLHRWVEWSPWEGLDENLARTYSGAESGVGAAYEWSGNRKAGTGRMLVTAVEDHAVRLNVDFVKPFKSSSKVEILLSEGADGTTVRWLMHTPQTAMTKVMGIFMKMDKLIGPDLERGLAQLAKAAG